MKRTVLLFILAAIVLITVGIWFASGSLKVGYGEMVTFGVIIMVVGFAVYIGFQRLSSLKKGEPAEDEMSKKIMIRTSSLSYYISIYLWLAVMYFSGRLHYETHTIIGGGILGMAIIFAICWLYFNFRGIGHE